MDDTTTAEIAAAAARVAEVEGAIREARVDLDRALGHAQDDEVMQRGDQAAIVRTSGRSREHARKAGRRYFRTVLRTGPKGEAWVSLPSEQGVHSDAEYEIRSESRSGAVRARISGKALLELREKQKADYVAEDPKGRSDIWLVDVSDYLS